MFAHSLGNRRSNLIGKNYTGKRNKRTQAAHLLGAAVSPTIEAMERRVMLSGTPLYLPTGSAVYDPFDYGGMATDAHGNLFGTSYYGGANNEGTVWEVKSGFSSVTVLASFNGTNGDYSYGGVIVDSKGDIFGTGYEGGAYNEGDVWELAAGNSTITDLADFNATNGQYPEATPNLDSSGDLFGTAAFGGANGAANDGDVWELAAGNSTITDLADFNSTNGRTPFSKPVIDSSGDVFGEGYGGANNEGDVWEVAAGKSTITDLADFNLTNGESPYGGMVLDSSGDLFGTAEIGGANNDGDIWELGHGNSTITDVADFNDTNGYDPSGVVGDPSGDLFGETYGGGTGIYGTMFELANGASTISDLLGFYQAQYDYAYYGYGTPAIDSAGDVFGVTPYGYTGSLYGALFELPGAATSSGPTPMDYTIPSDGDFHNLLLSLDSTGEDLQITDNGVIVKSEPLSLVNTVDIFGATDQGDNLTVDYSNGFFTVPVNFDGGTGGSNHSLTVEGANSNDTYTPGPGNGAGELDVSQEGMAIVSSSASPSITDPDTDTISFTDLSPVTDLDAGNLTVNGTPSNDVITYSQGAPVTLDSNITDASELSGTTVTITTALPNGYAVGDPVTIAGVATGFNGTFTITGVLNNTQFTYTAGSSGLTEVTGSGTASVSLATGQVNVNTLEEITFANQASLTIATGLGNDEVLDDVPATDPTLMNQDVAVNFGDPNANNTLVYGALPENIIFVVPIAPGVGFIGDDFSSSDPQNVDYEGLTTLQVNGIPNANALDIEQGDVIGPCQFTVTPSVTPGAGNITGVLNDLELPLNVKAATKPAQINDEGPFTMNLNYNGFLPFSFIPSNLKSAAASSLAKPDAGPPDIFPVMFGFEYGLFESEVIYNGVTGGGNYIVASGDYTPYGEVITDYVGGEGPDQQIAVYNYDFTGVTINLGNGTNDGEFDSNVGSLPTTFVGAGIGSSDSLYFYNDYDGALVTVDANESEIFEGDDAPVYGYGLSFVEVDAESYPVLVEGTDGYNTMTYTPTSTNSATITFDPTAPILYLEDVGSVVTLDPGNDSTQPQTLTINATPASDTITADGDSSGNPTVEVNDLLTAAIIAADITMLDINGGTGDNNLTVDSTNGAFSVPITYNGGPGNNNSLTLQNGTATSDTYTPGPLPGEGSDNAVIGGVTQYVEFDNLAPFSDDIAGPLTVKGTSGSDTIGYGEGTSSSIGEVDVDSFEAIDFTNKTTLTINTGAGNDAVTLNNPDTPTGLTGITVNGGNGLDSLIMNAFGAAVSDPNVGTAGVINIGSQPTVDYSNIVHVTILNALDSINVTPAPTIHAAEGQALNNVAVGTFTGGPVGAVAGNFVASINWEDGHTSTGTISGSNGSFSVTGSHTYSEYGTYHPVVTVTDSKTVGNLTVSGVPFTVYYTAPLDQAIDDTADVTDPSVIGTAVNSPVVIIPAGGNTGTITVATFTDPGGADSLSHYSATINWGDAQHSSGAITVSGGVFTIKGSHTYSTAGLYTLTITIDHDISTPTVVTDTNRVVVINPSAIHASGATLTGNEGRVATGTVATFTVTNTNLTAADFSASIWWGDGSASSAGTITETSPGHFSVTGSHAYAEEVTYNTTIKITEVGGDNATTTGLAKISPSPLDELAGTSNIAEPLGEANLINVCLGTFRDQSSLERDPTTYTGVINWGDGHTSTPTFIYTGSTFNVGSYWKIEGSHKYTAKGNYTVTITFHDLGGPFVNSVITSKISIQ